MFEGGEVIIIGKSKPKDFFNNTVLEHEKLRNENDELADKQALIYKEKAKARLS